LAVTSAISSSPYCPERRHRHPPIAARYSRYTYFYFVSRHRK
jgi:hypothetical protein